MSLFGRSFSLVVLGLFLCACKQEGGAQPEIERPAEATTPFDKVVAELKPVGLRTRFLTSTAEAQLLLGQFDEAKQLLGQAWDGVRANKVFKKRDEVLADLAVAFSRVGSHGRSREIEKQVRTPGLRQEIRLARSRHGGVSIQDAKGRSLLGLIEQHAAGGDIEEATKNILRLPKGVLRSQAVSAIAVACTRLGRHAQANSAFENIPSVHWRDVAWSKVAVYWFTRSDKPKMARAIRSISSGWMRARTYALLAVEAHKQDKLVEARKWFKKSSKIALKISESIIQGSANIDIALAYVELDQLKSALEILSRIESTQTRNEGRARLISALAKKGLFSEAADLLKGLESDPIWYADALAALAVHGTGQELHLNVLKRAEGILLMDLRVKVLGGVVAGRRGVLNPALEKALLRAIRADGYFG